MKDVLAENLMRLRGRIASACERYDRDTDDIAIVAVSKTQPPALIKTAVAIGLRNIGESRVQEAEPKIEEVGRIASFHMVGHLQSNKVKKAVSLFDVIQSVDSTELAKAISREANDSERIIECLLQVNSSGENQKFGVHPEQCLDILTQIKDLPAIHLAGLMTIGPLTDDEEHIRRSFGACRELFLRGRDLVGDGFTCLSMGMSDDFELAIAEGSNMIRVGTILFGPRNL